MSTTGSAESVRVVNRSAIAAAMLGVFICLLDVNVVNVALPDIQRDLAGSLSDSQWVVNLYVLALAAFIIPAGVLGDVLGVRRVFLCAIGLFAIGSALCGAAGAFGDSAMVALHVARVIQGVGGAFLLPLSLSMIFTYSDRSSTPKLVGLWGAVGGLATAVGPLIGGVLTDQAGWEWVFFINLPVAVVIAALLVKVPATDAVGSGKRVPIIPALVVGLAFLALTLALTEGSSWGWGSLSTLGLLIGAVVVLLAVVAAESRRSEPLVPRYLLRDRSFQVSLVDGAVIGVAAFSMFFFFSYYLQVAGRLDATATGLMFLPMSAALILFAPIGPRFVAKIGPYRTIGVGLAISAVGVWWAGSTVLAGMGPSTSGLIAPTVVLGVGIGLAFPSVSGLCVAAAAPADFGLAASAGTMARQVGNAIGIAVFGAILAPNVDAMTMSDGMRVIGTAAGLLLALAAVLNMALPSQRDER